MDATLTILTYNILNGGRGREDDLESIITAAQPDIVLLQELYDDALLGRIARSLDAAWFFSRSNSRCHLGLISRYPIISAASYRRLPIYRAFLEATIALPSNQHLHLWGVHLVPHLGLPFELWRAAEMRALMRRTRRVHDQLCLIAGDFNAIAPDERVLVHALPPNLRRVVLAQGGRVYHYALATIRRASWNDCYRQLSPHTDGWTLPSQQPNARLDYIFANTALAQYLSTCTIVTKPELVRTASDHLPVQATFSIP